MSEDTGSVGAGSLRGDCENPNGSTENTTSAHGKPQDVTNTHNPTAKKKFKDCIKMWLFQNIPRGYIENFEVSSERNLRDVEITKLLRIYVIMYRIKVVTISIFKFIYPFITLIILGVVVQAILRITEISVQHIDSDITITGLTALITSLTALLATLYGNLKHMWKYLYDKNDETHVAEIVKAVQANDLKNKRNEADVLRFQDAQMQRTTVMQLQTDIQKSTLQGDESDKIPDDESDETTKGESDKATNDESDKTTNAT